MDGERVSRCIVALHDFGSREGATMEKVMRQLFDAEFTAEEISAAADSMIGGMDEERNHTNNSE